MGCYKKKNPLMRMKRVFASYESVILLCHRRSRSAPAVPHIFLVMRNIIIYNLKIDLKHYRREKIRASFPPPSANIFSTFFFSFLPPLHHFPGSFFFFDFDSQPPACALAETFNHFKRFAIYVEQQTKNPQILTRENF